MCFPFNIDCLIRLICRSRGRRRRSGFTAEKYTVTADIPGNTKITCTTTDGSVKGVLHLLFGGSGSLLQKPGDPKPLLLPPATAVIINSQLLHAHTLLASVYEILLPTIIEYAIEQGARCGWLGGKGGGAKNILKENDS